LADLRGIHPAPTPRRGVSRINVKAAGLAAALGIGGAGGMSSRAPRRIALLLLFVFGAASAVVGGVVEQWGLFELELTTIPTDAPVTIEAEFVHPERTVRVNGFADGPGRYLVRFMPDRAGEWQFRTASPDPSLVQVGHFTCGPARPGNQGPVHVGPSGTFRHASGRSYAPIGTTIYRWAEQEASFRAQTLAALRASPFNKARMKILGPNADGRSPALLPFVQREDGSFDFNRPEPAYFRVIDEAVRGLLEIGVEADLIFLHPYDLQTVNLNRMTMPEVFGYLDYIIARYGAFRHVWWTTNEFDLMNGRTMDDWHAIFAYLMQHDPYGRLRSNHNAGVIYDHSRPWITHVSLQGESWWQSRPYRAQYAKPLVFDEFCYEGDGSNRTVALSGEATTHRFWLMTVNGAYATHGEALRHPVTGRRFFSEGGELIGVSHHQLQLLRRVIDEAPGPLLPVGADDWRLWNILCGSGDDYFVYYLGDYQNGSWEFNELPAGKVYRIELLDTRNGRIEPMAETVQRDSVLTLPGRPYLALRLQAVR
jgi:hypothetical protein